MSDCTIDFEPLGRRGPCRNGESLLECARRFGLGLSTVCGGQGTCRSCRVRVLSGAVSAPSDREHAAFSPAELQEGWRLACQTYPAADSRIHVPPESLTTPQRTQVEGLEIRASLAPPVLAYRVRLAPPTLFDPRADVDRLLEGLNAQPGLRCARVDSHVLRLLPSALRACAWECQAAVRHDELVAVGPWPGRHLGLAVDVGTTKIAGYLVDLSTGQTLAAQGIMNPQISYGEDVVSRIAYAATSEQDGVTLQKVVIEVLNQLAAGLCAETASNVEEIVEAVAVGNTAMHHLLLGLPVRQLGTSPFIPAVTGALDVKARDLGLRLAPGAYVHLLPNIAGFVGADHVAMLLATEAWRAEGPVIALDIGTNTEISLVRRGEVRAISCASGPAFEGGHILHGMRAARGAIERVRIAGDAVQFQCIDGAPPFGICGSGVLDAVAQLFLAGIIDQGGRMRDGHPRVRTGRGQREFVLVGEEGRDGHSAIVITQRDIRELQLAKAAIRSGIEVLLEDGGCAPEGMQEVVIAGAFGTYIDVGSAVAIGMLPKLPLGRFRQVGNAAGMGAKLALVSLGQRAEAQEIASRVRYIELATYPAFREIFLRASYLGEHSLAGAARTRLKSPPLGGAEGRGRQPGSGGVPQIFSSP